MPRNAPRLPIVFLISAIGAIILLGWIASILAAGFDIGPAAGLKLDMDLETKARITRYSFYLLTIICAVSWIALLVDKYSLKSIPYGFAAILISHSNNSKISVSLAKKIFVWPFIEQLKLLDMRPRSLNVIHETITRDDLKVVIHVELFWQPYADDLQMIISDKIQQDKILREMAQNQLTLDIGHYLLEELQASLETLELNLMRFIAYQEPPGDCGKLYGIALLNAKVLTLELPKEITDLALNKKLAELRKKYGPTQPGISGG